MNEMMPWFELFVFMRAYTEQRAQSASTTAATNTFGSSPFLGDDVDTFSIYPWNSRELEGRGGVLTFDTRREAIMAYRPSRPLSNVVFGFSLPTLIMRASRASQPSLCV